MATTTTKSSKPAGVFVKKAVRAGVYKQTSLDPVTDKIVTQTVYVSPQFLRKAAFSTMHMIRNGGLTVPVCLDHQDEAVPKPVQVDEWLAEEMRNSVGVLEDVKFNPETQEHEYKFSIKDPIIAEKVRNGIITTVSPNFHNEFSTGNGSRYTNVIAHLALTFRPRDFAQSKEPMREVSAVRASAPDKSGSVRFSVMSAVANTGEFLVPMHQMSFNTLKAMAKRDSTGRVSFESVDYTFKFETLGDFHKWLARRYQWTLQMSVAGRFGHVLYFAVVHAPVGGITIGGRRYLGGQFIPTTSLESLHPEDRKRVQDASAALRQKRTEAASAHRGADETWQQAIKRHVGEHASRELSTSDRQQTVRRLNALRNHHGDQVAERIAMLAGQDAAKLAGSPDGPNAELLKRRLAAYHAMSGMLGDKDLPKPQEMKQAASENTGNGNSERDEARAQYQQYLQKTANDNAKKTAVNKEVSDRLNNMSPADLKPLAESNGISLEGKTNSQISRELYEKLVADNQSSDDSSHKNALSEMSDAASENKLRDVVKWEHEDHGKQGKTNEPFGKTYAGKGPTQTRKIVHEGGGELGYSVEYAGNTKLHYLNSIEVPEDQRGKGIAGQMLDKAFQAAKGETMVLSARTALGKNLEPTIQRLGDKYGVRLVEMEHGKVTDWKPKSENTKPQEMKQAASREIGAKWSNGAIESGDAALARVKESPNQPKDRNWDKYADTFGMNGDFEHVEIPTDVLKKNLEAGHLRGSNSVNRDAVNNKVKTGDRNPIVISKEPGKGSLVVDGNHSLHAAIQNGDKTVKAIVSKNSPLHPGFDSGDDSGHKNALSEMSDAASDVDTAIKKRMHNEMKQELMSRMAEDWPHLNDEQKAQFEKKIAALPHDALGEPDENGQYPDNPNDYRAANDIIGEVNDAAYDAKRENENKAAKEKRIAEHKKDVEEAAKRGLVFERPDDHDNPGDLKVHPEKLDLAKAAVKDYQEQAKKHLKDSKNQLNKKEVARSKRMHKHLSEAAKQMQREIDAHEKAKSPALVTSANEHTDKVMKDKPGKKAVDSEGESAFNDAISPLRSQVEKLDDIAKKYGSRYAWESTLKHGGDHDSTKRIADWKKVADDMGVDSGEYMSKHKEYNDLLGRLSAHRNWGSSDATERKADSAKKSPFDIEHDDEGNARLNVTLPSGEKHSSGWVEKGDRSDDELKKKLAGKAISTYAYKLGKESSGARDSADFESRTKDHNQRRQELVNAIYPIPDTHSGVLAKYVSASGNERQYRVEPRYNPDHPEGRQFQLVYDEYDPANNKYVSRGNTYAAPVDSLDNAMEELGRHKLSVRDGEQSMKVLHQDANKHYEKAAAEKKRLADAEEAKKSAEYQQKEQERIANANARVKLGEMMKAKKKQGEMDITFDGGHKAKVKGVQVGNFLVHKPVQRNVETGEIESLSGYNVTHIPSGMAAHRENGQQSTALELAHLLNAHGDWSKKDIDKDTLAHGAQVARHWRNGNLGAAMDMIDKAKSQPAKGNPSILPPKQPVSGDDAAKVSKLKREIEKIRDKMYERSKKSRGTAGALNRDIQNWQTILDAKRKELKELEGGVEKFAIIHAPAGGADVDGHHYLGGQFTPNDEQGVTGPAYVEQAKDYSKMQNTTTPEEALSFMSHEPNYAKVKKAYISKNATINPDGSIKSIPINTDDWREYIPGYIGTNAHVVHQAASTANDRLFKEALETMKGKGNKKVAILGGGGGSGKGTAVGRHFDQHEYPIRVDQVSGHYDHLMDKIKQIKEAGFEPDIVFVDRSPHEAWQGVVGRAMDSHRKGQPPRTVPYDVAVKANIEARKVALRLAQENPDINLRVIDNNGEGDSRLLEDRTEIIKHLLKADHNPEEEMQKAREHVNKLESIGKLPSHIAAGLRGPRG